VPDGLVSLAGDRAAAEPARQGDTEGLGDGGFEQMVDVGLTHVSHVLCCAPGERAFDPSNGRSADGVAKT